MEISKMCLLVYYFLL